MPKSCKICGEPQSPFIMNNKSVCLRCDELLFDLEIECDEEVKGTLAEKANAKLDPRRKTIPVVKK